MANFQPRTPLLKKPLSQAPAPTPAPPEVITPKTQPTKPSSQPTAPKPTPPQTATPQPPQETSLISTLQELQDPQVVELLTTMNKIVLIAKQEKNPGRKSHRTLTQCLTVGDFSTKHRSWNLNHPNNTPGTALFYYARAKGLVISAPSDPTIIPAQQNIVPAIIDLGLSFGLNNISVETRCELSSAHNPVHFVVNFNFNSSHRHNCKTITNWSKFQNILTSTIAVNPSITNTEDIEEAIANFNYNIHTAINQSSRFLSTQQAFIPVPYPTRLKIREKNRLRKRWQETRFPPL
ncbi:putative RNA-directed DNA polymerase from transposon X-element [Trichonephila inaurata madagascariensis]|uniref:Putative RNA-directed DNA polymerase from transposon X-element n=1 Tax=Trichonephila inaurata madagascariensis TaxID=2747483 RepID=A0A8X6WYK5_9ARAC|nr:putative RNA-directed DNA polymerase from transposon X-element [Trichonephila inaurata madagascariensis]GFY42942.1 putative RNA-directed DNA polymerase from transposon X-element [Trichonephila inaurata madagascariensis]GFY73894.1 putative RNA-directed DNA polymerase from transposon X-element [Trichonephila inaurata madagascariensis]